LERLQTDYIDLYQLNWPQDGTTPDETFRALGDLVHSGKVRHLGWATIAPWQAVDFNHLASELGVPRFVSIQAPYHLLDRRAQRELMPMAKSKGFSLFAWGPLAGGFLTGKYRSEDAKSESLRWGITREHFCHEAFRVVDRLQQLASDIGCTPAQLSTAWVLSCPAIASAIVGPRTVEQLDQLIDTTDVELSDDQYKSLDAVAPPGGSIVPYLIADHGPGKFFW